MSAVSQCATRVLHTVHFTLSGPYRVSVQSGSVQCVSPLGGPLHARHCTLDEGRASAGNEVLAAAKIRHLPIEQPEQFETVQVAEDPVHVGAGRPCDFLGGDRASVANDLKNRCGAIRRGADRRASETCGWDGSEHGLSSCGWGAVDPTGRPARSRKDPAARNAADESPKVQDSLGCVRDASPVLGCTREPSASLGAPSSARERSGERSLGRGDGANASNGRVRPASGAEPNLSLARDRSTFDPASHAGDGPRNDARSGETRSTFPLREVD